MPLRFFVVPIRNLEQASEPVNAFLASHQVFSVDRRWVDLGTESFWAFCIDYHALKGAPFPSSNNGNYRPKVDYKEVLSPQEFAVYSRLRAFRKTISQTDAVPVYAIFSNEQLAEITRKNCRTLDELATIDGIGEGRVKKYGERLLAVMNGNEGVAG